MILSSRVVGAGTHTITPSDSIILADTTDGVVTINLPSIVSILDFASKQGGSLGGMIQFPFTIVDVAGNASVNNILIIPFGGDRYSGAYWNDLVPTVTINQNGGSASFKPVYGNIWDVNISGVGGGNPQTPQSKSLIMKISQTGLSEPKIDYIGQNDFGVLPIFTYVGVGQYQMTINNAFPDAKKVFFIQKQVGELIDAGAGKYNNVSFVQLTVLDESTIDIITLLDGQVPSNSRMSLYDIQIIVFP